MPNDGDDERIALGRDIALRPIGVLDGRSGRGGTHLRLNHSCIGAGERLLEQDLPGPADVRFTLALCSRKASRMRHPLTRWAGVTATIIPARPAEDGRRMGIRTAGVSAQEPRHGLRARQLSGAPAAVAPFRLCVRVITQTELDSSVLVPPSRPLHSEDELISASSEATVLPVEGEYKSASSRLLGCATTAKFLYSRGALAEAQELFHPTNKVMAGTAGR